jgi:hypothetical protein
MYGELPQHIRPLTQKIKELKSKNDYAVNVILNSVSARIAILFDTTKIINEM